MVKLQAQYHAGKKTDQHNDLGRFGPDKINLLDDGGNLLVMKNLDKSPEKKDRNSAQVAVDPDGAGAKGMKKPGQRVSRFR